MRESELMVVKIEAFVKEQKQRVKELEARLHQTDQVGKNAIYGWIQMALVVI